jgi:hypothetical protein
MKYEIKNRWIGTTIFADEADSFRALILAAIKSHQDLSGADLSGAYLSGANLSGADLSGANLSGANLSGILNSELTLAQTSIVPEHGSFTGWKKCRDGVLVQVQIPESAKRSSATGRKCRAERVLVLQVIGAEVGISQYKPEVTYRASETVECDSWNKNRFIECGGGIHFFLTRIEAENFSL